MKDRFVSFIKRQVKQIEAGGLAVLMRKLFILLKILLALPLVVILRLLKPFVLVRFGPLPSSRIAHFIMGPEIYLCKRKLLPPKKPTMDFFYHNLDICNNQFRKMLDRVLSVHKFAKWLDRANRALPGSQDQVISVRSVRDVNGFLEQVPPHLYFTAAEEKYGKQELEKIGVGNGAPFICFHSRTQEYLKTMFPGQDYAYHAYRNTHINNYIPAVEEMTRRGYFALRMGAVVNGKLNLTNPRIIDYASGSRTDFLDVYLGANCVFFISDSSGIYSLAAVFRKPIAWVNYIPLQHAHTWEKDSLLIPKKLWQRDQRRFLTFREIFNSDIHKFFRTHEYEKLGLEPIENTPEEILGLTVEMDKRLKGEWQTTEEDEKLQQEFWALFKPTDVGQVLRMRIGAEFLRENRELLE